jgi:hypothetical protein
MKRIILSLCLLVFVFSISLAQEELTRENRKTIKEAVEKRSQEFWNLATHDYNDENLKKLVDFMVDTDDEVWLGKPAFWIGVNKINYTKDEIKEGFEWVFNTLVSNPTKINEDYFAVIAPDVVIEVMTQDFYDLYKNGYRGSDYEATSTIVWMLKKDQWKIFHVHNSQEEKE